MSETTIYVSYIVFSKFSYFSTQVLYKYTVIVNAIWYLLMSYFILSNI